MKQHYLALFFSILAISMYCTTSCDNDTISYSVKEGRIMLGDVPQYFIGTNMWYAPQLALQDSGRLSAELDTLCALGIKNLRIQATDENFEGMDIVLQELEARGMQAVLYLNNAWEWTPDGYASYLEKAGEGKQPHPAVEGYHAYVDAMSRFAQNGKAVALFHEHVRNVVSRYSGSPAVFSWQICNEPRPFSTSKEACDAYVEFLSNTAKLIKELDPRHLVSTGAEGAMGCNDGDLALWERSSECPEIDYLTIHIWPYNWRWVSEDGIEEGAATAIGNIGEYIRQHLNAASLTGKPIVIEEFGYPRDGFKYVADSTVNARNSVYEAVFKAVCESAASGGRIAGCNFWTWSGFAKQTPGHQFYQEGDDLCGDPSQEAQGLNGVYITDVSTISLIKEYTSILINNSQPQ